MFCWNNERSFYCKSRWFSHFVNKKYWHIWDINSWKFNETLTNDVASFQQPGPGPNKSLSHRHWKLMAPLDIYVLPAQMYSFWNI